MIYIDVETDRYDDNFAVTIYKDCVAQKVISYNMNIIGEHIRNISKLGDETLCISDKEKSLTNYLDQIGVSYRVLNYDKIKLLLGRQEGQTGCGIKRLDKAV